MSFSILDDVSINTTVGPSSTGGYTCTPSIPNGEVTTSGQLVISGRLDVSDGGTYRCTSTEISGDIIIELVATGKSISSTCMLFISSFAIFFSFCFVYSSCLHCIIIWRCSCSQRVFCCS